MVVKLLTEHQLEFPSFKGGCRGLSEATLVIMPHCWKSHALANIINTSMNKNCNYNNDSRNKPYLLSFQKTRPNSALDLRRQILIVSIRGDYVD